LANLSNALSTLDVAITKVNRLRREAEQAGNPDLATKMRRLKNELEEVQTDVQRAKRELN
jgi:type III secretory pathway component EscU